MAFSFPYSFTAKTLAEAAKVMANFNAIKTILEGGITLENFDEGAAPTGREWTQEGVKALSNGIGADLLPSGSGGESLVVPVKSKVLFVASARIDISAGAASISETFAELIVDGAVKPIKAQLEVNSTFLIASVADSGFVTLEPGTHAVRLFAEWVQTGTTASCSVLASRVTALMIPTT